MWVFPGLSFIPFLPLVELGFVMVATDIFFLAIRRQVKFNNLLTSDADYQAARKSWRTSLLLLLVALPVAFIVRPLFYVFSFGLHKAGYIRERRIVVKTT